MQEVKNVEIIEKFRPMFIDNTWSYCVLVGGRNSTKYLVSTRGEVVAASYNRSGKPKAMTQLKNNMGYPYVQLSEDKKTEKFLVSRLVAQTFLPNPENKPQVNHIDNDPTNNRVENLEWVTRSENMKHSSKQGRMRVNHQQGENNSRSKLTKEQVLEIRDLFSTGLYTKKAISDLYQVSAHTVGSLIRKEIWAWL